MKQEINHRDTTSSTNTVVILDYYQKSGWFVETPDKISEDINDYF